MQRITGYTRDQLSHRLRLLEGHLSHDIQRGKGVRTLVGDQTLAALRRMAELEQRGLEPQVAATQVLQELNGADGEGNSDMPAGMLNLLKEKDRLIAEQAKMIAFLQREIDRLQDLLHRQLPPAGSRRWRWRWPWPWRRGEPR